MSFTVTKLTHDLATLELGADEAAEAERLRWLEETPTQLDYDPETDFYFAEDCYDAEELYVIEVDLQSPLKKRRFEADSPCECCIDEVEL